MVLDFRLRPNFSITSRFALIRSETGLLVLDFGFSER